LAGAGQSGMMNCSSIMQPGSGETFASGYFRFSHGWNPDKRRVSCFAPFCILLQHRQ